VLNDVERDYSRFQNLLKQAGGITYSVQSMNHAFSQSYPVSINSTTSDRQMIDSVRQLRQDSLSAFKHSLTLGAGGRQVLAVVRRIEDEQSRARKRANSRCKTYREEWGDRGGMIFTGHHKVSGLMRGRRSAAQASVNQRGLAGRSSARDEDIAALLDCEPQDFARSGSMTPEAT
jgi:hypothetical protein